MMAFFFYRFRIQTFSKKHYDKHLYNGSIKFIYSPKRCNVELFSTIKIKTFARGNNFYEEFKPEIYTQLKNFLN